MRRRRQRRRRFYCTTNRFPEQIRVQNMKRRLRSDECCHIGQDETCIQNADHGTALPRVLVPPSCWGLASVTGTS
jgi:hypothetical protein